MRRTVLALLAATLLAPTAAIAQTPDVQRLASFLPIAQAAWPGSPCAGHEQILLNDDAELDALAPRVGVRPDGVANDPGPCDIGISSGLTDYTFCVVLTHELGHIAGEPHSTDPESVMYPTEIQDYQPCLTAVAALAPPMVQPSGFLARRPRMVADDGTVRFPRRKHPKHH